MGAAEVVVGFAAVVDSLRRVAENHQRVSAKARHLQALLRANLRAAEVVAVAPERDR